MVNGINSVTPVNSAAFVNPVTGTNSMTSVGSLRLQHEKNLTAVKEESTFARQLREKTQQDGRVRFSRHAAARMAERSGEMSAEQLDGLNRAVETARQKGARDTLIIQGQNAFIVNVPNNVVVTMVSYQDMKENIFTNIDSTVLI